VSAKYVVTKILQETVKKKNLSTINKLAGNTYKWQETENYRFLNSRVLSIITVGGSNFIETHNEYINCNTILGSCAEA
jgi:hypothetical protein